MSRADPAAVPSVSSDACSAGGRIAFSARAGRTEESPISFLVAEAMRDPALINLAAGLVDPRTLPVSECEAICRTIFTDAARGRAALQYDTTLGLAPLRRMMLEHFERLEGIEAGEMGLSADDLVLTTGSQQALYLVGDVLLDPGDIVIAANPSYFVYAGALSSLGAAVVGVPMDEEGMDVQAVADALDRLEREGRLDRVKLVYCTSYFQNPTGLTLSADRRPALLDVVKRFSRRHRILILEDAAYRELRYDGAALRSIKSYDRDNRCTILSHTFSKPFAPGIKLGCTAMPSDLMQAVVRQKGNHDFGSSSLTQHIALEAFRDGSYARHVERLRQSYRAKRDVLLNALSRRMPAPPGAGAITWTRPHGGLYSWVTLPQEIDTSRESQMFRRCVEAGVLYVPGAYCFHADAAGDVPRNHLRLSFGQVDVERIEPGVERLAGVVRGLLDETPGRSSAAPDPSRAAPASRAGGG